MDKIRATFDVKDEFRREITGVDCVSKSEDIEVDDLFVFPNLVMDQELDFEIPERRVESFDELISVKYALIRGNVLSGKTTICRKLFLHLSDKGIPAMLIDLEEVGNRRPETLLRELYFRQMKGDYSLWEKQPTNENT